MDLDACLVVGRRGERLALARRDGRVALDQLRHDAAEGFDTQRQRGDVEKKQVLDLAAENASLDRGPDRHEDRKSTRLNSSHVRISYAVFCLKKIKAAKCDRVIGPCLPVAARHHVLESGWLY